LGNSRVKALYSIYLGIRFLFITKENFCVEKYLGSDARYYLSWPHPDAKIGIFDQREDNLNLLKWH